MIYNLKVTSSAKRKIDFPLSKNQQNGYKKDNTESGFE